MEHYKLYKLLKTINGGGTDTSDATVIPEDLPEGVIAYGPEGKIEGTIPDKRGYHVMGYQRKPYIPNGWSSVWVDLQPGPMIINDKSKYQINMQFTDMANTIGLTADKLKAGETVMEMKGTYSNDGTATAEDIISPKTAYVNGQKITGTIVANNQTLSGGMTYETANLAASYTILDISDNYGIALLGTYNTNQFYVYKMENNAITSKMTTITNTDFGVSGTLMTAHIAQKVNSLGNLNIFAQFHVDGQLNATLCAIQINPETFEIVKKGSTTLSGKSLRGAVHCGSLAINPVYPGVVGLAFTNSSTSNNFAALIMQYNESTNAFSQKAAIGAGSPYPSNPVMTQWDKDGLVFHFGEIGGNIQSLQKIVKFSNTNFTSWSNVYDGGGYNEKVRVTVWNKSYWFRKNELRNMSNTVVKTYSEFSVTNNTLLWTYDNYLFVGDTANGLLKCYRIDSSTLNLTLCFEQIINTTFPTNAFQYYFGGIQYPASHTHRYYKDTGNTQIHFKLKDATEIPISVKYHYKDLYNTEDATVAAGDIVSGKIAYTKNGKITGTVQDNRTSLSGITTSNLSLSEEYSQVVGQFKWGWGDAIIGNNITFQANLTFESLASVIGLTSEKLVEGNTILGVQGTAKTENLEQINTCKDLALLILGDE